MNNLIKFVAISLLLFAGSVNEAKADNWTNIGLRAGCWNRANDNRVSYDGIIAFASTDKGTWGTYSQSQVYWQTGDYGIIHASNPNTVKTNTVDIGIGIYKTTRTIPSYSKLVRNVTFQIAMGSNRYDHGAGLYLFNDENTASTTVLDATYNQVRTDGDDYKVTKIFSQTVEHGLYELSEQKNCSLIFDNHSGEGNADISKYTAFMHSSGSADKLLSGQENASWTEVASDSTWYFYKYLTYDANEGTGTAMAEQTIENSGTLTANTYTRTAYRFTGWNTQADGKGTSYSDGGAITATLEDKGPVTLYAQWETVAVSISESGYATVFSDKKIQVPAGVEVYGFTYSDGALVQSAMISEGAVLPANNGYLVKASAAGTYYFTPTEAAATAAGSDLTGTAVEISTPAGNVYVWGKPDGYNYGWYKYTGAKIPAGKAYYVGQ